ncbi:MAG: ScyD/ScyE family protein [Microthrixaceae bacterium]|nr:ScyD/ScyE family protein [Microthrixaceae bacterium]
MSRSKTVSFAAPAHARSVISRMRIAIALLAVVAMALAGSASAGASQKKAPKNPAGPHAQGLVMPLSMDLLNGGTRALVSQAGIGTASIVSSNGSVRDVFAEEGLNAVAAGPFGTVLYTANSGGDGPEGPSGPLVSQLKIRFPGGQTHVLADLGTYEQTKNPDGVNTYGITDLDQDCAAQWPTDQFGPPSFTGGINSNPFKLAVSLFGVYVVDSGANAILFVDWMGRISTVAVLPPQPTVITDPSNLGLPDCVAGHTYNFEAVPTDMEFSWLSAIVSLLPGGPEGPELGARGSVVRLNLWNGKTTPVAGGFLGATDLAVSPAGTIYVTELFGDRVTKVTKHGNQTVAELPMPAAIEWAGNGRLVVAYNVFASGEIATIKG